MEPRRSLAANRRRLAGIALALTLGATTPLATGAGVGAQSGQSCVVYWLQLGAFRDAGNAGRLAGTAAALVAADGGPAPMMVQVDIGGAPLYRVLSGPHDAAAADARKAVFLAAAIPVSASTSTLVEGCPATAQGASTAASTPVPVPATAAALAPAPVVATVSASAPGPGVAGFQVQAGAFRSAEYAQLLADSVNAALGGQVVPGEFTVVAVEAGGAPLYRVRSRTHPRADADVLLAMVRAGTPQAALAAV